MSIAVINNLVGGGGGGVSTLYLIKNNVAIAPFIGGAVQTTDGVKTWYDSGGQRIWRVDDIDLTHYNSLTFTYDCTYNNASEMVLVINTPGVPVANYDYRQTGTFTHTYDVSAFTGSMFIALYVSNNYGTTYLKEVKLEV